MKRRFLLIALSAGFAALAFSSYINGPYAGGAGNRTGSTGTASANCSGSGCHAANSANTSVSIELTLNNAPVTKYTPGTTYLVTINGATTSGSTLPKFGFQATCVKAAATGTQAGTFSNGSNPNIDIRTTATPNLVEHNTQLLATAGTPTTGYTYATSFTWTAPLAGTGTVRFYATLNAVNNNSGISGDQPNTATPLDIPEVATGIGQASSILYALYPNPATSVLNMELAKSTGCRIDIIDFTGKVYSQQETSGQHSKVAVDISRLIPGAYFVRVLQDGATAARPFIKQ